MSCPHVAGVAALLKSLKPELKGRQLRELIETTARDLGDEGFDIYYGHGLVDAMAAAKKLMGTSDSDLVDGGNNGDSDGFGGDGRPEGDDRFDNQSARVTVAINFDYYASDTHFEVLDMDRNIVGSGTRFHDALNNATMDFELPSGCYWFGIRDVYGDG